ncbi:hypothetical protein [Cyanobium sp. ATX 6F1]|uniref:hypothetical protein n=1 Tax=Cyanobium sp. ATX 6F1 TaxID=2823702 RepID=UPI0020CC9ACA|nr:hypothetical protein [Cyanobium sp. ATX 6F1]
MQTGVEGDARSCEIGTQIKGELILHTESCGGQREREPILIKTHINADSQCSREEISEAGLDALGQNGAEGIERRQGVFDLAEAQTGQFAVTGSSDGGCGQGLSDHGQTGQLSGGRTGERDREASCAGGGGLDDCHIAGADGAEFGDRRGEGFRRGRCVHNGVFGFGSAPQSEGHHIARGREGQRFRVRWLAVNEGGGLDRGDAEGGQAAEGALGSDAEFPGCRVGATDFNHPRFALANAVEEAKDALDVLGAGRVFNQMDFLPIREDQNIANAGVEAERGGGEIADGQVVDHGRTRADHPIDDRAQIEQVLEGATHQRQRSVVREDVIAEDGIRELLGLGTQLVQPVLQRTRQVMNQIEGGGDGAAGDLDRVGALDVLPGQGQALGGELSQGRGDLDRGTEGQVVNIRAWIQRIVHIAEVDRDRAGGLR